MDAYKVLDVFQSTLPVGGATFSCWGLVNRFGFQSTLPVGGATEFGRFISMVMQFQSTLPVGGATTLFKCFIPPFYISIHAPRGGSDAPMVTNTMFPCNFNPRSPWGERPERELSRVSDSKFQSTLPVGGATPYGKITREEYLFQSTLPVGGAT